MLRRTLVSAFISSRLDYCNNLLSGVTSGLLTKLQSVQNAAARFVSMSWKFDHITPILRDLHWLPVRRRIDFKVATLVYKCLHGFAPPYLIEDCVLVASLSGRQHLRSADHTQVVRSEDLDEIWVTVFRSPGTQLLEQPSS